MEKHSQFDRSIAEAGSVEIMERQKAMVESYLADADKAMVVDSARTTSTRVPAANPLYAEVVVGAEGHSSVPVGVHTAVGGLSDYVTPGDLLCAALASCLDSTIRIIANRMSIPLKSLSVEVRGSADVRGTLKVDPEVPVGFQQFTIDVDIQPMIRLPENSLNAILKGAEYSCVVLQTLQHKPVINLATQKPQSSEQAA